MLISGKGKYFSVFGCILKNFPENIFWCLEKKKENTNPKKIPSTIAISQSTVRDRDRSKIATSRQRDLASSIAIWGASSRSRSEIAMSRRHEIAIFAAIFARSRRLELGLEIDAAWSSDWRSAPPGDRLTVRFLLLSRARALSLSLSFFFRKCFEVKMRGENHFQVKGENTGQPEVIFRKISFSVTAKHTEKGENDFLKSFSPKTNAP